MASGSYTYICIDCREKQILSRAERASHFRSRCRACGSLRLEAVSKDLIGQRMLQHDFALLDRKQRAGKKKGK